MKGSDRISNAPFRDEGVPCEQGNNALHRRLSKAALVVPGSEKGNRQRPYLRLVGWNATHATPIVSKGRITIT